MSLLESFIALYFCVSMSHFVRVGLDIASGFIWDLTQQFTFEGLIPRVEKKPKML